MSTGIKLKQQVFNRVHAQITGCQQGQGSSLNNKGQTRDGGASSLTGVTALCPWARHIKSSLVLVQPRKTCPYITERLLMRCKKSNQPNKQTKEWQQDSS